MKWTSIFQMAKLDKKKKKTRSKLKSYIHKAVKEKSYIYKLRVEL